MKVETIELPLPQTAAAFERRLREAGLPVGPERAARFADALSAVRPISRRRLYWTARAVFVSDRTQVRAFDAVFADVFGSRREPEAFDEAGRCRPRRRRPTRAPPSERPDDPAAPRRSPAPLPACLARGGEGARARRAMTVAGPRCWPATRRSCAPSALTRSTPMSSRQLHRLMSQLSLATPHRLTRRAERRRHGRRIDVRRTLRGSMRTGGDPIRLARRERRIIRRRIVLLCDISGSMEPYARAYLQFLVCAAGAGPRAEAFVFATRLTRLTRALASRNPDRAIERAAAAAPDWSSGTRIGDALKEFNDRHGRRGMARGAVVVILSDGWERGDPGLVGREMERLRRLAYRIVWVNPRAAAAGFSPRAGGMAAALPFCDALVSGHTLEALEAVADEISAVRGNDGEHHGATVDEAR